MKTYTTLLVLSLVMLINSCAKEAPAFTSVSDNAAIVSTEHYIGERFDAFGGMALKQKLEEQILHLVQACQIPAGS